MSEQRFFISSQDKNLFSPKLESDIFGTGYYLSDNPSEHYNDTNKLYKIQINLSDVYCFDGDPSEIEHLEQTDHRAFFFVKSVFQLTTKDCEEQISIAGIEQLVCNAIEVVKQRKFSGICMRNNQYQYQQLTLFSSNLLAKAIRVIGQFYFVECSTDHETVWVHCSDGSTVGRFSVFGIDIHNSVTAMLNGAHECLLCTHNTPSIEDWEIFRSKALELWDIDIPENYVSPHVFKTKLLTKHCENTNESAYIPL